MSVGPAKKRNRPRATRMIKSGCRRISVVPRSSGVEVSLNLGGQRGGRDNAGKGAPAQNPVAQRPVVTDVEGQDDSTVGGVANLLRRMPHAGSHERRDARLELDVYTGRLTRVHAERVGEYFAADPLLRRECLFL